MSPFLARFTRRLRRIFVFTAMLVPLVSIHLHAKTAGLTAVEIYPGSDGQVYAQIADFILNGKNEVYLCAGTSGIDKSAYRKLVKVPLAAGMSLERDAKGVLMLSRGAEPACVVPGNLKFDKGGDFSAAELAEKAEVEGRILSGSDPAATQIAPLKPGVKLVFVPAPDQELAEYLRAERAGDIHGWQGYLGKYAAGPHASAASKSLAALYLQIGNTDLQAFESSKGGNNPEYGKLKESRQMADQARALAPDDAMAAELNRKSARGAKS